MPSSITAVKPKTMPEQRAYLNELFAVVRRHVGVQFRRPVAAVAIAAAIFVPISLIGQTPSGTSIQLGAHQYDLSTEGRAFLIKEASRASFFMLGELHGDNEIPA